MSESKFKPNQVVWAQDQNTDTIYPGVVIDPNNALVKSGELGEARKGFQFLLWLGLKEAYLTREDRLKDFCSEFATCFPKMVQDNSAAKEACKTLVKMAMARGKVDVKSVPDWEAWATENAHNYSPLSLTSIFYNSMARNCKARKPESVGVEPASPEEAPASPPAAAAPASPSEGKPSPVPSDKDEKATVSSEGSSSPARSEEAKPKQQSESPKSEVNTEVRPFSEGAVVWAKDDSMSHYWPSMFAGKTEECPKDSWTVVVTKKQPSRIYIPEKSILEFGGSFQKIYEESINKVEDKSYKMAIRGVVMFIAKKKGIQIPEDMTWKQWAKKNIPDISNFVADPEELSRLLKASESTKRAMPEPKKEKPKTSPVPEQTSLSTEAPVTKTDNGESKPDGDTNGEARTASTEPPADPAPAPKKRKFKSAKQIAAEKEAKRLKKLGIDPPPAPAVPEPEPEPEPVRAPSPKDSSDDDMDTGRPSGSGDYGGDDREQTEEEIMRAWKKRMKKQKKLDKLRRIKEMEEEAMRAKIERKRARKLEKMRARAIAEGRIAPPPSDKPHKPKKVELDADGNPKAKRPILGVRKRRGDTFNEEELDMLRIPLDRGWTRELVQRKTDGPKFGDVYYKPPKGKKLRSMNDVQKFLEQTGDEDLKVDYFSFADIKCHLEGEIFIPA